MLRNTSNFILPVSSRLSTRFASTKIDPRVNISGTFEAQTRTYEESGSKKSRNFRSSKIISTLFSNHILPCAFFFSSQLFSLSFSYLYFFLL